MSGKAIMMQALTNRREKSVYYGTFHFQASAHSYWMNIYIYHFFNPITFPKAIISGLHQSKQTKLFKIHTFYSHAQPQNFKIILQYCH